MTSRALFANAAKLVFDTFTDIPEQGVLVQETAVHDPLTAENVRTAVNHSVPQVVLTKFKREEIGAPLNGGRGALTANRTLVETSDTKAILQQAQLPVTPEHKDTFIVDGATWIIEGVAKDPSETLWFLQLRAK